MSTTPAPNHSPILGKADDLRKQAESLIRTLSAADAAESRVANSSPDLLVDGYARVLALDLGCLRLEREIADLAESGDPRATVELQELAVLLRCLHATSEELRNLLDAVRSR